MNLALLDAHELQAPLPEVIEDKLVAPNDIVVCEFNRRGSMLAGGCKNGAVVVWDFDTHGIVRTLTGHEERVVAVSWTRSSRRVLSGSADGKFILWDVLNATAIHTVHAGGEVGHVVLHPRNRQLCVACVSSGPSAGQAILLNLSPGSGECVPLLRPTGGDGAEGAGGDGGKPNNATYACFAQDGALTLVGTSRGQVHILRTATQEEVVVVNLPGSSAIKSLAVSRDGKWFLSNSADRTIRVHALELLLTGEKAAPPRELQDVVNRVQWAHANFSSESEHVVGTANWATDHLVYIWDMHGHLKHILGQGNRLKDGAVFFACHPTRPILAVCSRSGAVYVWTKKYSENWSAFAPDFKELEENEEYVEREDEFDLKPDAELEKAKRVDEEEVLDILSPEKTGVEHVPDAEDDEPELLFLPVVPEEQKKKDAGKQKAGGKGGADGSEAGGAEDDAEDGEGDEDHLEEEDGNNDGDEAGGEDGDEGGAARKRRRA